MVGISRTVVICFVLSTLCSFGYIPLSDSSSATDHKDCVVGRKAKYYCYLCVHKPGIDPMYAMTTRSFVKRSVGCEERVGSNKFSGQIN